VQLIRRGVRMLTTSGDDLTGCVKRLFVTIIIAL
jgi:hypothetical protein